MFSDHWKFHGVAGLLDTTSDDGRFVYSSGFTWSDLPLPVVRLTLNGPSEVVGKVDRISVHDTQVLVWGTITKRLWKGRRFKGTHQVGFDLDQLDIEPYCPECDFLNIRAGRMRAVTILPKGSTGAWRLAQIHRMEK